MEDKAALKLVFPVILGFLAVGFLAFLFWPGYMSSDSIVQFSAGLAGQYSDHHPPMMSFMWRLLGIISSEPYPYLLFHLSLLLCAIIIFQSLTSSVWLRCVIAGIPLMPSIAAYSGALWKDVGIAYSFLLAGAILARAHVRSVKPSILQTLAILLLLMYEVGVKYQGQFVLPVMGLWLGITLTHSGFRLKSWMMGAGATLIVLWAVLSFNQTLVPQARKQHSWQVVKLYDLAGISLRVGQDWFPAFVTVHDGFSLDRVRGIYSPRRVDELIQDWYASAPIPLGQTEEERTAVWDAWVKAVCHNPGAYLAHRFSVWKYMISQSPLKPVEQLESFDTIPKRIQVFLKRGGGHAIFTLMRVLSQFSVMLPVLLFYVIWGACLYRRQNVYGFVLLMMNLAALALLSCLFIFSMAADLRYIYLSSCFVGFSHPIAFMALREAQRKRKILSGGTNPKDMVGTSLS